MADRSRAGSIILGALAGIGGRSLSEIDRRNENRRLLQQQMEEDERKRQQGILQEAMGTASTMQPTATSGMGRDVIGGGDVTRFSPAGIGSLVESGAMRPIPGTDKFEVVDPRIGQARSQMAMEAAKTSEQTQKSIQATQYTKAINEAATATSEHARDLKLLEAHYAKGGSLQEFNTERKKLRLESDTLGRIDVLQAAAVKAQMNGQLQSVSMGPTSVAFSLKGEGGAPTGDTFKDLSKTMEGFNNVRANLVETHAKMRKLPQEQAKIRAELALVSMKEFMSLAAVPGPIVKTKDGKEAQTPNPYVRKMIETYKAHLNVDWATFDWNDPNAIVGLADQMGEALATVGLGPKEAAAAQVSMWDDAISWLKGVGKGSDTGTAKPRSDEERYGRVFKRGISAGQRQ